EVVRQCSLCIDPLLVVRRGEEVDQPPLCEVHHAGIAEDRSADEEPLMLVEGVIGMSQVLLIAEPACVYRDDVGEPAEGRRATLRGEWNGEAELQRPDPVHHVHPGAKGSPPGRWIRRHPGFRVVEPSVSGTVISLLRSAAKRIEPTEHMQLRTPV